MKRATRSGRGSRLARQTATGEDRQRGRAAHARRDWEEAYTFLRRADRTAALPVEDLDRLARASVLTGRHEAFLETLERIYQAHLDAGDDVRAARAAFWIGFRLLSVKETGRAGGWIARSQRLVDGAGRECVEQGYLLLPVAQRHLGAGDWPAAFEAAGRAAAIGESFRDADLATFGRNLQGRALIRMGRTREGLALIDEVMVAVTGGELSPIVAGITYCIAIATCQQVYALDRAREWVASLTSWCEAQPQLTSFTGACQVHRAEIHQLAGAWPEAIEQARRVSERPPRTADNDATGDAFYQQAEVHRLRGARAEAEEAYRRASEAGRDPQPGLALLRLAQGRTEAAASGLRRALGAAPDPLQRARLLPACVEILLASGDVAGARGACEELEAIAGRFETEVLAAMAAHARGAVRLAEGDAGAALGPLRRAFAGWQAAGAPYAAARVRVLLAEACRALGDADGATLEREAARAVFERLSATPDLAALDRAPSAADATSGTTSTTSARPHRLTARELEVLRLIAVGKTNRAIAEALFLSGKTVDRHVSNIFTKIHVSTRAAATAFAYENRIVRAPGHG